MNVLFLTVAEITNINERGIYTDLLREFRDKGHAVYVIAPVERRKKRKTSFNTQDGISILNIQTLNIQKTNVLEKGIGTILLERQFLGGLKQFLNNVKFDLVLYATPPITLTRVIQYVKQRDGARSYLLLKDIFPQNAVDLGMMKKNGVIHSFFRKKEAQLYKVSDFIGCMSPANVAYLLAHNPGIKRDTVEVNPNSISPVERATDKAERAAQRQQYNIPPSVPVFLYGGNLGKPQGIDFLIDVLAGNRSRKDVFFVIVGSGTEYPKLKTWVDNNHPGNVLLLSNLPKRDYDKLVMACDIGLIFLDKRFTIPNFPSRLLSYLENQMPVLAATDANTDIGTIVENAKCGFGLLSGDLKRFNEKIDYFVAHPDAISQMGANARNLLVQQYTIGVSYSTIVKRLNNV